MAFKMTSLILLLSVASSVVLGWPTGTTGVQRRMMEMVAEAATPAFGAAALIPTFTNCDAGKQGKLTDAITLAQTYQAGAWAYLQGLGQRPGAGHAGLERYTTWFGAYDDARYLVVYKLFEKISTYPLDTWEYECAPAADCGGFVSQFSTNAQVSASK
ncbi:hypothetical protein HGRIS_008791 [Hohenbuehelia grisea]|uniref:Uncharacterized protein n=1 Tax=Hohenbuehelia grisea TaxID=104357 RepID=A0ABR3J9N9_9AGAR